MAPVRAPFGSEEEFDPVPSLVLEEAVRELLVGTEEGRELVVCARAVAVEEDPPA